MSLKIKLGERHRCIPSGQYRAKVTDIREGFFVAKRRSFEFFFEIADGDHAGVVIRGYVNAHYDTFSEYTKLRRWILAVGKVDSEPGTQIDLDLFYGKILLVEVETKNSKKTGNQFSNVVNLLGLECEL